MNALLVPFCSYTLDFTYCINNTDPNKKTGIVPSVIKFNVACSLNDESPIATTLMPKIDARLIFIPLVILLFSVKYKRKIKVNGACSTLASMLIHTDVFSGKATYLFKRDVEMKNIMFAAARERKYLLLPFCLIKMMATGNKTISALMS